MHSAPRPCADGAGGPLGGGGRPLGEQPPIRDDLVLRLGKGDPPVAHLLAKLGFDCVLGVRRCARLGPQVAGIVGRAAELEWHEVVVLVVTQRAAVAVGRHARGLLLLGDALRGAHGGCPALDADRLVDRGLGHGGVEGAGRAGRVRAGVEAGADRVARAWRRLRLHDVVAGRRVREARRPGARRLHRMRTMPPAGMVWRPCGGVSSRGRHCCRRRRRGRLSQGRPFRVGADGASRRAERRDHERRRQRARAMLAHRPRAVARRRCPSNGARQPMSTEGPTPRRPPARQAGARSSPNDRAQRLRTACH